MAHDHDRLLDALHHSLVHLADAVADAPDTAQALRRFAAVLPRRAVDLAPRPARRRPSPVRPLLYRALAEGVVDARQFDRGMIVATRARRALDAAPRGSQQAIGRD